MGAVLLPKGVKQRLYVADEAKPAILDVLEVERENLMDCSTPLRPPYPQGFEKIGTVEYMVKTLSPEVVQGLRRNPTPQADGSPPSAGHAQIPTASAGGKKHFFSRLFGRLFGSANTAP